MLRFPGRLLGRKVPDEAELWLIIAEYISLSSSISSFPTVLLALTVAPQFVLPSPVALCHNLGKLETSSRIIPYKFGGSFLLLEEDNADGVDDGISAFERRGDKLTGLLCNSAVLSNESGGEINRGAEVKLELKVIEAASSFLEAVLSTFCVCDVV